MSSLRPRIRQWENIWDHLLSEPGELLLGHNFLSLSSDLNSLITTWLEKNPGPRQEVIHHDQRNFEARRIRGLITEIADLTSADDGVITYLTKINPNMMQDLAKELGASRWILPKLQNSLDNAISSVSTLTAPDRFATALLASDPRAIDDLRALTSTLLFELLQTNEAKSLQPSFHRILPREAMLHLLEANASTFQGMSVSNLWNELICSTELDQQLRPTDELSAGNLLDAFPTFSWRRSAHAMLQRLGTHVAQCYLRYLATCETSSQPLAAGNFPPDDLSQSVGDMIVREFTKALAKNAVTRTTESMSAEPSPSMKAFAIEASRLLMLQIGIGDNWSGQYESRTAYVDWSVEATGDAFATLVGELADNRPIPSALRPCTIEIGNQFLQLFVDTFPFIARIRELTESHLANRCAEWTASRGSQRQISELLAQHIDPVVRHLPEWFDESHAVLDLPGSHEQEVFWSQWFRGVSARAAIFGNLRDDIPWSQLNHDDVKVIVAQFLNTLRIESTDEWMVIYQVSDIDSEGGIWSIGNVAFYDPSSYDFGESEWLSTARDTKEPISLAKVNVIAESSDAALLRASGDLSRALDVLSFALSVRANAGGSNPQVASRYFSVNVSDRKWSAGGKRGREELSLPQRASESGMLRIAPHYEALMRTASETPLQLTDLQSDFLRSLHWYRKGRWEPDPQERFTFYWIAVEHLFDKGSPQTHYTYEEIPRFHITWRSLPQMMGVQSRLWDAREQIRRSPMIQEELNDMGLSQWESDSTILLELSNLKQILNTSTRLDQETRSYIELLHNTVRAHHDQSSAIRSELLKKRRECDSTLRRLGRVRNILLHEAVTYHPNMDLYARSLEIILEDVLQKLAIEAINPSSKLTSTRELVERYQVPWGA